MEEFSKMALGPRIYESDNKTYRIEEFYSNLNSMTREKQFEEIFFQKIIENFLKYNIIGDINHYSELVGSKFKSEFFEVLLKADSKTNFINFTLIKMKSLASNPLKEFTNKLNQKTKDLSCNNKECSGSNRSDGFDSVAKLNELKYKLEIIIFYFTHLEEIFYSCMPEKGMFVLSHNDANLQNVLFTENDKKVFLLDHEYSSYNFLGFDIANYLIENLFNLADVKFPYYKFESSKIKELVADKSFNLYLKFFEVLESNYMDYFKTYKNFPELLNLAKTKDYYLRVIGLSSIMWALFAVIYFDFETIWERKSYDYLNFSYDRLSIYHELVQYLIN